MQKIHPGGTKQEAWMCLEMRPYVGDRHSVLEAAQDKYDENCAEERPEPKIRHEKSYREGNSFGHNRKKSWCDGG